jgi:hypothetical protein
MDVFENHRVVLFRLFIYIVDFKIHWRRLSKKERV